MKNTTKFNYIGIVIPLALGIFSMPAKAASVALGLAHDFAVLGATTITNTGPSTIIGDLGLSPGTAITGFPPGIVLGTVHSNDASATQAMADAESAYGVLLGETMTQDLTGNNLGGLTLTPGVYQFSSSASLTGTLQLDSQNMPNALFIFQIGETFITDSGAEILGINGTDASQVFFQVGSSATLGTNSNIIGTIIANASNTLNTGARVEGRVISLNGAVTLDSNIVQIPEPSSFWLGLAGLSLVIPRRSRLV